MSGSSIKKRHVQGIDADNMGLPTPQPFLKAQTGTWHKTSEWQQDNGYILSGYHAEKADYINIFTSLTFLPNKTYNIYTHLIRALLLPLIAFSVMQILSQPQFLNVSRSDYIIFGIFFCCAECCLIFSTIYHLVGCHSHAVE
jgi:adiponectin receptor